MDKQYSIISIFKNIFQIHPDFESIDHSLFSTKACGKAECCRQKHEVKLTVVLSSKLHVFGSYRAFLAKKWVKLSVFGENAELKLSLSAKMLSKTVRFRQYTAWSEKKRN